MNFFELPHIIIVFHPGSAGNFIANLLNSLINDNLDNLLISNSGDSSFIDSDPMLSFGRHSFEDHRFENKQRKIQYYLDYINNLNVNQQTVLLTHNYSNIELYRKYYPNSKIVYISLKSIEEKIISILFQIEKTKFDKLWRHNWEIDTFKQITAKLNQHWYDQLLPILKDREAVINFIKNKYSEENRLILFYLSLQYYVQKLNLSPIFKGISDQDYINCHFSYSTIDNQIVRAVDKSIESFLDLDCIELPFDVIYKGKTQELIRILTSLFNPEFNQKQIEFIKTQARQYFLKQNESIVNDPFLFCNTLEENFKVFSSNNNYIFNNFTSFVVDNIN